MCQVLFWVLYTNNKSNMVSSISIIILLLKKKLSRGKDRNLAQAHTAGRGREGIWTQGSLSRAPHHSCSRLTRALGFNTNQPNTSKHRTLKHESLLPSSPCYQSPLGIIFTKLEGLVHCRPEPRLYGWHGNPEGLVCILQKWAEWATAQAEGGAHTRHSDSGESSHCWWQKAGTYCHHRNLK